MSKLMQENGAQPAFSNNSSHLISETHARAEQVCDFGNGISALLGAIPQAFNRLFDIVHDAEDLRDVNTHRTTALAGFGFDSKQIPNAYVRSRVAGMA